MTGAQALIESLKLAGVEHIFGYAGATICPAVDALAGAPEIGYTLVRTEQNAGHMASGYYRVTGKVGVAMVTSGPGATNLLTGIATAYMDSIPMVAITGQVPSHLLGRDIFQEVDITGAAAPFTKHSYLVKDANDIPRIVAESFHIAATGRPGPVLIDLPIDVQNAPLKKFDYPESVNMRSYKPSVRGHEMQIKRVVKAISNAKNPVIYAGGGVFLAHGEAELRELAERTNIPVVTTMMGLSLLPTEHPLNLGMIGAFGNAAANKALAKTDLLIMIGGRVADRAILSPEDIQKRTTIIHIDVDPAEIGKNMRAEIPVVGDVKVILQQLLEVLEPRTLTDWTKEFQKKRAEELVRPFPEQREGYVFPGAVMRALGKKLKYNAAVCVDVGQNQIWACKHLNLNGGRLLTSGGLGTMGYALPAAVGVKVAQPGRQTVVICGDGSFQMSFNELAAVVKGQMDIKIVLIRNNYLGLVRQIQATPTYPAGPFGVALDGSPNFARLAAAYGIPSRVLDQPEQIDSALNDLLGEPGPRLLIVSTDPLAHTND